MRLAPILAALSEEQLQRISQEHIRTDERLSHAQLCNHLESSIRSARFLADFIVNRSPPTFGVVSALLEGENFTLPADELQRRAMAETERICAQLDAHEILEREDSLRVYRRLLFEARRADADINVSESSLLGVYRNEHAISMVAHFLVEHHSDFREFWKREGAYEHELGALRAAGVLFAREDHIVLPEDIVAGIMNALGLVMTTEATRRLLEHVTAADMAQILDGQRARSSGSKAERIERILSERIQAPVILSALGIGTLRDLCRETGVASSGVKDELVDRLIGHFASGSDLVTEAPPPEPLREPRVLDEQQFRLLFGALRNQELVDVLRRREGLRQAGSKDQRIATLWAAHVSEENLLSELMNRDLEDVLQRIGLRLAGSKPERIARLIGHFASRAPAPLEPTLPASQELARVADEDFSAAQAMFCQQASSSQESLQHWLEGFLEAPTLVRCYSTEVANPTQQLKNKLAQAAAAKNGLLVLTLADADALAKTESALVERWAGNDEWSKSIACVALAQPQGNPKVEVLIERAKSTVAALLKERVFPQARCIFVGVPGANCVRCGVELPPGARFCPGCGVPAGAQAKSDATATHVSRSE